jgi:adenylate cyclase
MCHAEKKIINTECLMIRFLNIVSGLTIFAFVTTHLISLSLGIISLELLENTRPYFFEFWRFLPIEILLIAAFLCHASLAMLSLYNRNTLRLSSTDLIQLISSLLILPLLIPHVVAIKVALVQFSIEANYRDMLAVMWINMPYEGLRQVLLVMTVWIHGCLGLFTWLRLKSWWKPIAVYCYPLAVIIPTLALLGFVEAGRDAVKLNQEKPAQIPYSNAQSPNQTKPLVDLYASSDAATSYTTLPYKTHKINEIDSVKGISAANIIEKVNHIASISLYSYFALLGIVLMARQIRLKRGQALLEIHYSDDVIVNSKVGSTLLEIAIANDIPHANLCHGKGRCGTCRVKVIRSNCQLSSPTPLEQAMLKKLECPENTRLACQTFATAGTLYLENLVAPDIQPSNIQASNPLKSDLAIDQNNEGAA